MVSQQGYRFSIFITISDGDFTQKLLPDFIQYFNGEVPVEFVLRNYFGRCWIVEYKRVKENILFRQGWSEFVEDNSLELGDSIVLENVGDWQFYYKIYRNNGSSKVLHSSGDDIGKPIDPKREQELKPIEKLTRCDIDFDYKYNCEAKWGRDSVGSGKNKRTCEMAVKTERTMVHEAGCSFKAERPSFILTWRKQKDYQVEIPEKFLREEEVKLPVDVVLKDHGGIIWPIGLRKAGGRVWFKDGWKQFIEYHSISDQQFLNFRYDGNSQFDVSIFDNTNKSACVMKDLDDIRHHEVANLDKRCELNEENGNKSADETISRYKSKRSIGSMSSSEKRPNTRSKKKRSSVDQG